MIERKLTAALAAAIILICWYFGGPIQAFDTGGMRLARDLDLLPGVVPVARWLTFLGSYGTILPLALIAAVTLAALRRPLAAMLMIMIPISGRLLIELLKWLVERPRPELSDRLVPVHSMSFPSGHAGNSMIALLTAALLLAPPRHRAAAAGCALLLSIGIGMSRVLLQVHWPTDVLAGWLIGLLWVSGWMHMARRGTVQGSGPLFVGKESVMTAKHRDDDNALIDDASSLPTPKQGGSSGGELARDVGERDEYRNATGSEPSITRVHKSDKPRDGDRQNLPNRDNGR